MFIFNIICHFWILRPIHSLPFWFFLWIILIKLFFKFFLSSHISLYFLEIIGSVELLAQAYSWKKPHRCCSTFWVERAAVQPLCTEGGRDELPWRKMPRLGPQVCFVLWQTCDSENPVQRSPIPHLGYHLCNWPSEGHMEEGCLHLPRRLHHQEPQRQGEDIGHLQHPSGTNSWPGGWLGGQLYWLHQHQLHRL